MSDSGAGGAGYPWAAVPAALGRAMRPALGPVVEAIVAAVREEVPEYDRPLEGEFGELISRGVTVALEQFVDLLGQDVAPRDLRVYEALGRQEYREGRALDALQSAYRTGARVAWQHVVAFAEATELDAATGYRLAEAIFAYIDTIAGASVAGYAQEQSLQAGSVQARRHALIELIVRRPPAPSLEVEHAAEQAGWALPATVAAVAVGDQDAVVLARRLPDGTIGAMVEPVGLLLVPDPDGPGRRRRLQTGLQRRGRAVVGPTVPWADVAHSASRAIGAWSLHAEGRLGSALAARADDHLLDLLLVGDPRLTADLVARRLAPLEEMTPAGRERAVETLRAWLDAHGDVALAADRLQVHAQTVRYRLARLREAFGDALDDPAARLELELALRAEPR